MLRNLIIVRNLFSSYETYGSEARKILQEGIKRINKDQNKLHVIYECLDKLQGTKLGLVDNQVLLQTFLESSNQVLASVFGILKQEKSLQAASLNELAQICNLAEESQLSKWSGLKSIEQFFLSAEVYKAYADNRLLLQYLKMGSLLHQMGKDIPVHTMEKVITHYKIHPLKQFEDRLLFYKGILSIRQMDKDEKMHLKSTIYDIAQLENRSAILSISFLEVISEYINIVIETFFAKQLDSTTDIQAEDSDFEVLDESLLEPLNRLFRLYQQQDGYWYNWRLHDYEDEDSKVENIGFKDPIRWRNVCYLSKGLRLLYDNAATDQHSLDLLEHVIVRKLETEQVNISDGVQIFYNLTTISKTQVGPQLMLIKSICDQIVNEDLNTLSIYGNNLAQVFDALLSATKLADSFEESFLQPAIQKLTQWVLDGRFDSSCTTTDWFDIQTITSKHSYNILEDKITKQIES